MNFAKSCVNMETKYKRNVASLILAVVSTVVTPFVLKGNTEYSLSNSLFSIVFCVAYFVLIKKTLENFQKRLSVISMIVGLVFDVFMVLGRNIYITNKSGLVDFRTWLFIFGMLPVFYSSSLLIMKYLPKLNCNFMVLGNNTTHKKEYSKRTTFFIVWFTVFISWLPALLASYPGVYGYDSIYQIKDYLARDISLQHPLMHTYLLGFCVVELGEALGSYEAGMFCYSIIQMLCLSATFATIYTFYIKTRASKLVKTIIILVFMFLPTNAILSFSTTKDVLFAAFFALAVMLLVLLAEQPELIKSVKFDICLCFIFFMMAAWRSQGIYVIVLTAITAIIFIWQYKKNILIVFMVSILLIVVYTNYICVWLGGKSSDSLAEMMSIPCVQLSRAMLYNEEELDKEERELIQEYIGNYEAYSYNSGISDLMKRSLNTARIKDNPTEFIKLWVGVGLKCPITYFDAFARLTIGYWYPDMNYRDVQAFHPYWEYCSTGILKDFDENTYLLLEQTPIRGFEWLYEELYELTYENKYQSIAVVSLLFSSGLSVWIVFLYIAVCIYRKEYKYLVPAGFVFALILTLLLGPVVLYRYIYPVCMACPMLLISAMNFRGREDGKVVVMGLNKDGRKER